MRQRTYDARSHIVLKVLARWLNLCSPYSIHCSRGRRRGSSGLEKCSKRLARPFGHDRLARFGIAGLALTVAGVSLGLTNYQLQRSPDRHRTSTPE